MQKKKKPGRKSVLTKETVAKLVEAFRLGMTDEKACEYSQIDRSTLYRNLEKNKDFATQIHTAKYYARMAASSVLLNAIEKDKDITAARWWLERRYPDEFGIKSPLVSGSVTKEGVRFVVFDGSEKSYGEQNTKD